MKLSAVVLTWLAKKSNWLAKKARDKAERLNAAKQLREAQLAEKWVAIVVMKGGYSHRREFNGRVIMEGFADEYIRTAEECAKRYAHEIIDNGLWINKTLWAPAQIVYVRTEKVA